MKIHKLIIISSAAVIAMSLSSLGTAEQLHSNSKILGGRYHSCGKNLRGDLYSKCGKIEFKNYPVPKNGCISTYWLTIYQKFNKYKVTCSLYTKKDFFSKHPKHPIIVMTIKINQDKTKGKVFLKKRNIFAPFQTLIIPNNQWSRNVIVTISGIKK